MREVLEPWQGMPVGGRAAGLPATMPFRCARATAKTFRRCLISPLLRIITGSCRRVVVANLERANRRRNHQGANSDFALTCFASSAFRVNESADWRQLVPRRADKRQPYIRRGLTALVVSQLQQQCEDGTFTNHQARCELRCSRTTIGRSCRDIILADGAGWRFDSAQQVLIIQMREYGTVEYVIAWP